MLPTIGIFETYPILLSLGVVMAFVYLEIYFRKKGENRRLLIDIEINGLIAVIVGVFSAILWQNLYDYLDNPANYAWSWSMTFYGGLIGGVFSFLVGYFAFLRKKYGPFLPRLLIIAPASIAVAHGFGRIGCFCAGCCYGEESNSPFALQFPHLPNKVLPTNLWEALFLIALSLVLLTLALKKNTPMTLPVYLISYGTWRFIIEFFRGDYRGSFVPGITPSQFWSILLVLLGIAFIIFFQLKKRKSPAKYA